MAPSSKRKRTCSWIDKVPDEILLLVLQKALQQDWRMLLQFSLVCRRWCKLTRDDRIWRILRQSIWLDHPPKPLLLSHEAIARQLCRQDYWLQGEFSIHTFKGFSPLVYACLNEPEDYNRSGTHQLLTVSTSGDLCLLQTTNNAKLELVWQGTVHQQARSRITHACALGSLVLVCSNVFPKLVVAWSVQDNVVVGLLQAPQGMFRDNEHNSLEVIQLESLSDDRAFIAWSDGTYGVWRLCEQPTGSQRAMLAWSGCLGPLPASITRVAVSCGAQSQRQSICFAPRSSYNPIGAIENCSPSFWLGYRVAATTEDVYCTAPTTIFGSRSLPTNVCVNYPWVITTHLFGFVTVLRLEFIESSVLQVVANWQLPPFSRSPSYGCVTSTGSILMIADSSFVVHGLRLDQQRGPCDHFTINRYAAPQPRSRAQQMARIIRLLCCQDRIFGVCDNGVLLHIVLNMKT